MVINELLSIGVRHCGQGVVFSSQFTGEFVKSGNNVILDLISLLLSDAWTEWESGKVSSNSNSGRNDHRFLLFCEWRAVEFGVIHIADVSIVFGMTVIILNDSIEEAFKCVVSIMTSSINTDS